MAFEGLFLICELIQIIFFKICSGPAVLMLPAASNKTPMLIGSNGNEINDDINLT